MSMENIRNSGAVQPSAHYQLVSPDPAESKQYIKLDLPSLAAKIAPTLKNLQESLQIECVPRPSSAWQWCCLLPSYAIGCYLPIKLQPGDAIIYVVKSSALKLGLKKEDLKSEKSFETSCKDINDLILKLPPEFWKGSFQDSVSTLIGSATRLIDPLAKLKEGESIVVFDLKTASSTPFILNKVSTGLTVIKPEENKLAEGGFASVYGTTAISQDTTSRTSECVIRVLQDTESVKNLEESKRSQDVRMYIRNNVPGDSEIIGVEGTEKSRVVSCFDTSTGKVHSGSSWRQASISKRAIGDATMTIKDPLQKDLVATQITQGLSTIHKSGVIHGDVKLKNILLYGGENKKEGLIIEKAKIADFGNAVLVKSKGWETREQEFTKEKNLDGDISKRKALVKSFQKGPASKRAQIKSDLVNLGQKMDVFQLGLALFQLYGEGGTSPNAALSGYLDKIPLDSIKYTLDQTSLNDDKKSMILRMMDNDPEKRPIAQEVAEVFKCVD